MALEKANMYKDGEDTGAGKSTVGKQLQQFYWYRKALLEIQKDQVFLPMADVRAMPKHYGKKIKQYHWIPLLDDRNMNDQGIDANGAVISASGYKVTVPALVTTYAEEADATAAEAAINAAEAGVATKSGVATPWLVTVSKQEISAATLVLASAITDAVLGAVSVQGSGNLYGSSKDIGKITSKMPALSEEGGRVNRVGYTRKTIEGEIAKFGFFDEFTQESMDFDTEAELEEHMTREALRGAHEITEAAVQIDLLNATGVSKFAGSAIKDSDISGETADLTLVTYDDLVRLSIDLDTAKCPKSTTMLTGSRMVDTKVIPSARYLYCGSEMLPTLMRMKDFHGNQAFVPVEQYAAAGNTANGEEGSVAGFRVIVVQEMLHWGGKGAKVVTPAGNGYRYSAGVDGENYDIYPMLVVGSGSFTTIGFQTDGKTVKFRTIIKKPGEATADRNDPYGEVGFHSIKWYYGSMILRPEWLAVIKSVAAL